MKNNIIDNGALIAPTAIVRGEVTLEKNVNLWYGAVIRGDYGRISIGEGTNIQDNCVVHDGTTIGKFCTVGHGAIIHGCTVEDGCLIGMGAIVLNGAVIGENSIIGAGAVVTGGTFIPPFSIAVGNPAKVIKQASKAQIEANRGSAKLYIAEAKEEFGK